MNLLSAFLTGMAVWPAPPSTPATANAPAVQVATVDVAPNYRLTALSASDVDMYLRVMRGAADHIAQVSTPDSAAVFSSPPGVYDEVVAERQGVRPRYDAVKTVVEAGTGPAAASDTTVQRADAALLAPHATEIQALQKQVNGFIYER